MPQMTHEEMVEFLQRPLVVSFTTVRPDGSPHTTPIWYEYDVGRFYCFASGESVKARNVRRDSRVALCIAIHNEPYQYVLAEGTCDLVSEGVAERAYSISTRYYGEERGREFARGILAEGKAMFFVLAPSKLRTENVA